MIRLLNDADLREKGLRHSRQHRQRLIKRGKFPKPIKVGLNTNAWLENEIDAYVESCIAERDAKQSYRARQVAKPQG